MSLSKGRRTRLFFFFFLHFAALVSAHVVCVSKGQIASHDLSYYQAILNTLQLSEAVVVPSDLFETFQIQISFHVCESQKYDHIQLLHEMVSVHLRHYLRLDQYTLIVLVFDEKITW